MSYLQAIQAQAFRPGINVGGPEVGAVPFSYDLSAALALNDIVGLCKLPAQHVITGCFINVPDLDTNGTPTIVLDFGLWEDDSQDADTDPTVVDVDAVVDGSTAGQAGGIIDAPNAAAFLTIAPVDTDRIFGALVETGPATGATSGTIEGLLFVRAAHRDD